MALEAPPAPPAGIKIVPPSTPPKAPPAPTREIKLGQSSRPTMVDQLKPSAAKQGVSDALYKKAGATPPPKQDEAPKASAAESEERPGNIEPPEATEDPKDAPEAPAAPTATTPEEKKKTNPWKVVDDYKRRTADLEKQLAEVKTKGLADQEKSEYLTKIDTLQKRNETLEKEMAYVDYSKSEEFKRDVDGPYQKAFQAAVQEMSELTITDPNSGAVRQVSAQDIVALANMPLADARKMANDLYGDFADDMMAHRKEIRRLYQIRSEKLKDAQENGSKILKERSEMAQNRLSQLRENIKQTWQVASEAAAKHEKYGKHFTPIEGDQDGNQRLAKGFQIVDRAFTENPENPNLTPEQRKDIIERHAAVRFRAAAFGRLVKQMADRDARIAELEKKLAGYEGSTPPTGGVPAYDGASNGEPASATGRVMSSLRKLAR